MMVDCPMAATTETKMTVAFKLFILIFLAYRFSPHFAKANIFFPALILGWHPLIRGGQSSLFGDTP
jgi:hypothetical protein